MSIAFDRTGVGSELDVRNEQTLLDLTHLRLLPEVVPALRAPVRVQRARAQLFCKRLIDIVGASIGLVVGAPVALVIALAVRISSGKHVLFKQTRVGRDGKQFTMYKLRTMHLDAERLLITLVDQNEGAGVLFKMQNDPRVTRMGRLLRRTSMDELPQLINVVKG